MPPLIFLLVISCELILASHAIHAQTIPTERAKLIEEAKKEGKVVVYAAYSAADANAFKAAFEKKYPFIRFEYFRAGKDKLLAKYLTEVGAGHSCPMSTSRVSSR